MKVNLEKLLENIPAGISVIRNPRDYDRAIRTHPFYKEMLTQIIDFGRAYSPKRKRVLEIGAGTGTLTERAVFGVGQFDKYIAIEPDEGAFRFLKEKMGDTPKLELVNDRIENLAGEKFDLIISSFVDHHIPYEKKKEYYRKIHSLLHPEKAYVSGEEFVQDFKNEKERTDALKKYHGWVIRKCLEENHLLMAMIEAQALKNGIEKFDEYKTSLKKYLERMRSAGFEITEKRKIGPDDSVLKNSGIYVVVGKSR